MKGTGNPQIIVYTGAGKGKTCAAMGQVVRALGHGGRCAVAEFLKDDPSRRDAGEWRTLFGKLGVLWKTFGEGREAALAGWEQAKRWISSQDVDLLVLDDFASVLASGLVDAGKAATWLDDHHGKKGFPNLVVTGAECPEDLVRVADIVSTVSQIKHSCSEKGRKPLAMIEF